MFLLLGRYVFLAVLGIFGFSLIYLIFTPLTSYLSFYVIKLVYSEAMLSDNMINIGNNQIQLIEACIAGSAYYLLLFLNLTTPIPVKKRIKSLSFLILSFLILNVARIFIFSTLFISGYSFFDLTHKIIWYLGSTIFVIALWFTNVYLFKIQNFPVYSDIKSILNDMPRKHL